MGWRRRTLGDFSDEIEAHIQLETERLRELGMGAREADRTARRSFGNVTEARERFYQSGHWTAWLALGRDFRLAGRMLRKSPAFAALAVLTLALGIGMNVAVFSMVDALLLRPLPVAHAAQLNVLAFRQGSGPLSTQFSLPDVRDIGAETQQVFSSVYGYMPLLGGLSWRGQGQPFLASYVTGNYFSGMGIHAYRGRLISPREGQIAGADPVMVLAYSYWKSRLGGDRGVPGSTLQLNGKPVTVIGIAPPGFHGALPLSDVNGFVPISMVNTYEVGWPGDFLNNRVIQNVFTLARLRPGVAPTRAAAALQVVARRLAAQYPATERGTSLSLYPETEARPSPGAAVALHRASVLFLALVGLILLLACVNVANLSAVRASAREREFAVRAALGAGRLRIFRQVLSEGILLGLAGGVAGIIFGAIASRGIAALPMHTFLPMALDFELDGRVFLYGLAAAVLAGLAVGAIPAWRASGPKLVSVLQASGRSFTAGRGRWRNIFVGMQVAGSLLLLVISFLFVRSLASLRHENLGFDPQSVVNFALDPTDVGYNPRQGLAFYNALLPRIGALPGVDSAALASSTPMSDYYNSDNLKITGYTSPPGGGLPLVNYSVVSAGYFRTLKIPVTQGRDFAAVDVSGSPFVAIVNAAFARKYWPGRSPLGQHFAKVSGNANPEYQVVGVAANSRTSSLRGPVVPYFYLPLTQDYDLGPLEVLQVRSRGPAAALIGDVRASIHQLSSAMPVFNVQTMPDSLNSISGFLAFQASAIVAAILGAVGMLLAVLGIYGVMSNTANLRRREIGIRMALGAQPGQVARQLLAAGATVVGCGIATGALLALVVARFSSNFLVGIRYTDPVAYAGAAALLAVTAMAACSLPARRAARVDPAQTLRQD